MLLFADAKLSVTFHHGVGDLAGIFGTCFEAQIFIQVMLADVESIHDILMDLAVLDQDLGLPLH